MTHVVKPRRYPHRAGRVYTPTGFSRRVLRALMDDGFSPQEARRMGELYFGAKHLAAHHDEGGVYRNRRHYRLYRLSRQHMKKDRKGRLFELVRRSGMFYVFVDDDGTMLGFVSPWAYAALGVLPVERM